MAFPSDYEGSIHRFVLEPNGKSLEAGDQAVGASPVSPIRSNTANEGYTLTHFPSKPTARHVENVEDKGSEANPKSCFQRIKREDADCIKLFVLTW